MMTNPLLAVDPVTGLIHFTDQVPAPVRYCRRVHGGPPLAGELRALAKYDARWCGLELRQFRSVEEALLVLKEAGVLHE